MRKILRSPREYIAILLIFFLLVSQTLHVNFFDSVSANQDHYRDIVSLYVDSDTYRLVRPRIMRYAEDVQNYLGSTQVSIFVVDQDTPIQSIASQNEKLYYEGTDPDKIDRLVGTILIGNVPIPVVHTDNDSFPSIYPYVDFVDKKFILEERTGTYNLIESTNQKSIEPEIWHGVINPAIGREWSTSEDIKKISNFFDKSHDFYSKQGVFSVSSMPPRVFYYDGFNESAATDQRSVFQYGLNMLNSENTAYKRFTKYLLSDINTALSQYDLQFMQEDDTLLQFTGLNSGSDTLDPEMIGKLPDIQTKAAIDGLLKDFYAIINKKTLGDQLNSVRNAGRYNDEDRVRADIAASIVTSMDTVARSTLFDANTIIMDNIDKLLADRGYAKDIPIFDTFLHKIPVEVIGGQTYSGCTIESNRHGCNEIEYQNYYFGQKSTTITNPNQCTIARGSNDYITKFGRSVLVEANSMYDVTYSENHASKLEVDTKMLLDIHKKKNMACFDTSTSKPKSFSYWGNNSMLWLTSSNSDGDILSMRPEGTSLTGMTESIFSLKGMSETIRFNPSSINDCTSSSYQYALQSPTILNYKQNTSVGETDLLLECSRSNLGEWNIGSGGGNSCKEEISQISPNPIRYSCLSEPEELTSVRTFTQNIARYNNDPCLFGTLKLNQDVIINADRTCINTIGFWDDSYTTDNTLYESVTYHTISSILRHASPTDQEILAAESTGITPALPVDMVRYVEFLTPRGNIARIDYPNFFVSQGDDISSFRSWLKSKSESDWNEIITQENATAITDLDVQANAYLGTGILPDAPIDWNIYISDEMITKIIQARKWLNPDITKKYARSIESMLSYSQNMYGTGYDKAPAIPRDNNSYEVAYLGLSSFLPTDNDAPGSSVQIDNYNAFRSKLRAINITEDITHNNSSPPVQSDQCGPPDGVNLFQWPSAIICWIKSLTPIKIVSMACGANTIGMKSSISSAQRVPTSRGLSIDDLIDFYSGGKLTYNISRTHLLPDGFAEINFYFQKNGVLLGFPQNTRIDLNRISGTSITGTRLSQQELGKYIQISPNTSIISENGSKFLVSAGKDLGEVVLQASIELLSSDGEPLKITSELLPITVTDEYLDVVPRVGSSITSIIDSTNSNGMSFEYRIMNRSGSIMEPVFPVTLNIYDEVGETYTATGIIISDNSYKLPLTLTRLLGVYRLDFVDARGREGSHSIGVEAGPLDTAILAPISTSMLRGSTVPVTLRLQDAIGNPITPDLHTVQLRVTSGYILMPNGERKTEATIDLMDSEYLFSVGTDTLDPISISAKIDDIINNSTALTVFDTAKVALVRQGNPKVGGNSQEVFLRIEGPDGNIISGFNSIAHIKLPDGAGYFSPDTISIRNGISDNFNYIPGQIAGDHAATVSIPGLGVIPNIQFSVLAGDPLYISHTEFGENIEFSLRDRYNNLAPANLVGYFQDNISSPTLINFTDGTMIKPRTPGILSLDVPQLAENTLFYDDVDSVYSLTGSRYYTAYISGTGQGFDFHDDYNARYTVLAGGSFLREAEDILYNTKVGSGQSLAVTTLLDTPYARESLLNILPGGHYSLYSGTDTIIEPTLSIDSGYPRVVFRDRISQNILADASYRTINPRLGLCTLEDCLRSEVSGAEIMVSSMSSGFTPRTIGSTVSMMQDQSSVFTIFANGQIQHIPGVSLALSEEQNDRGIIIDVIYGSKLIGKIYYRTDSQRSIVTMDSGAINDNTVAVQVFAEYYGASYGITRLDSSVLGLRVLRPESPNRTLDTIKNGPETIDSLGMLSEQANIGWQGSNRSLLAYAGGATVGESTRWFHTYTMINLGDPVTHNDKGLPGTELDGLDRTLGTQLTSSNGSRIVSFQQVDMNADGYDDILVLHTDGYVELILNLVDRFQSKGNIAHIPDIISRGFSVGDFTGDNYGDIIGIDTDGEFVLIDNSLRRFSSIAISVQSGMSLPRNVNQFKIRDMDMDNMDDIVYVSEAGELGILYGTSTPGSYEKNVLDATLGVTLSDTPVITGGAIYVSGIPQLSLDSSSTSTEIDETQLRREVYYPFSLLETTKNAQSIDTSTSSGVIARDIELSTLFSLEQNYALSGSTNTQQVTVSQNNVKNYIKSEYAQSQGIIINKTYKHVQNSILRAGDTIRTTIEIKNTKSQKLSNVEYLDSIPPIFNSSDTKNYTITLGNTTITREFTPLEYSDFNVYLNLIDIPVGETLSVSYDVTVLPASYGELLVGDYERGETGVDVYGDVGFKTDTTCGADMMLWRSDSAREYTRGTRTFSDMTLPPSIADATRDTDNNSIPDSIENMTIAQQKNILNNISASNIPATNRDIINVSLDSNRQMLDIGFDDNSVAAIQNQVQNIMDGLACGFGGGSCMSFPINWAPLAPGSAPVAFGYPLSALVPSTGLPVFSGLTGVPITLPCGPGCVYSQCVPATHPVSPLGFGPPFVAPGPANPAACFGSVPSAGGSLGILAPSNTIRIYATPTLTLGVGAAFCFGPAAIAGNLPPPTIWPLAPGGNCIVVAKPLSMCKDDGSVADGDVRGYSGLGTLHDTWNAKSCTMKVDTGGKIEDENLRQDIISHLRSPDKKNLTSLYTRLGSRTSKTITGGPLLRLGGASSGGALAGVEVTLDSAKPFNLGNIVKINNKRIAGFPDFIMDWVARQTDQITNALLTPPNLIIILPTSVGQNAQFDGSLSGLSDTFKNAYSEASFDNIKTKVGEAYNSTVASEGSSQSLIGQTRPPKNNAQSDLGKWIQTQQNSFDALQDSAFKGQLGKIANQGKGGIVAMRTAYKLIGKLPLISISEKTIPVNVPWILPQELDRYSKALDAYSQELNSSLDSFCASDPSAKCLAEKAKLETSGLRNSINRNLKIIEEYKNFPVKLQKYVTWKQRYLSQILCYITEIQQMTTGWVRDNSIRFQKWAELIVLIRTIADSWQPLLDIVAQKNAQCEVCRNERYNAKYFKYKIISALIPSIPVIQFPRWPDIILDLSDVRLGIVLVMPNFQFNLKPIRLPDLPRFSLPRGPNLTLTLPTIPILPPIPNLPDLPDLPAIPTIKLPNLPPPPKLPKLFASLGVALKILKFFKIMECYLNKTTLVPEWTVGDVIAQRTERQGTLPIDFLNIDLPQFSIPSIREIRVSSHINFELRSEFIAEFAQAAVRPINQFGADLGRSIPKSISDDVRIEAPANININLQSFDADIDESILAGYIRELEENASVLLSIDEFKNELKDQYAKFSEFAPMLDVLDEKIALSQKDAQKEEQELIAYNEDRFNKLRKYIDQQYTETAQMQNIIDLLKNEDNHLLSSNLLDRALLISDTIAGESGKFAEEWNTAQRESIEFVVEQDDSLSKKKAIINSRLKRITAVVPSPSVLTPTSTDIASGYAPSFRGIYVITEGGNQTRLFDYIDPLLGNDTAIRTDIDRDGDFDYLFLLDGTLYLKRATLRTTPKIIDTSVAVTDIDRDMIPTAPDFFHENSALSRLFSFSYRTTQDTDTLWRLELYDRYMEWDMAQAGLVDGVSTPRGIIELFSGDTTNNNTALRTLQGVEDPTTFVMEGPRMEILTGSRDFVVSPRRVLYAGDRGTTFLYSTGSAAPYVRVTLEPTEQIYFDEVTNISMQAGKIFILYPSILGEIYTFSEDIIGMPITTDMRISSQGEVILRDHLNNKDFKIDAAGSYQFMRVSSLTDEYSIQVPYANGFYFPKIQNLSGRNNTRAGEILFAPRASSDTSPPLVALDSEIRVPVYQQYNLSMRDIITEMSDYVVQIDSDLTQDTDGNGIYDDDFLSFGTGFSITNQSIVFGPFDNIGTRTMMMRVEDEYNNISIVEIPFEVYPPVPNILQATNTGLIQGTLDEFLQSEPINIFRLRTGTDIQLLNQSGSLMTSGGGGFVGEFDSGSSGSILSHSGNSINIGERGLLGKLPAGYTADLILADSVDPMHLVIRNHQGVPLYQQFFVPPQAVSIVDASTSTDLAQGLLLNLGTSYSMMRASITDPSIPGGVYVIDSANRPLIAIARDGNIYPTGSGVSAVFTQRDGYPQISLKTGGSTFVEVLYKFDFFYTLK